MHERIAVTFRGRCKKERGAFVLRESERVMSPKRADLQCRDRQLEIIDGTRRGREMKYVIEFVFRQENEIRNVVLDELEIRIAGEMTDVCGVAGDQVVDRDDAMTFREQAIRQMRSQKTRAAGDD